MCTRAVNNIRDLLRAFGGWGIIANKLAGVVYPPAFYLYYTRLFRSDTGVISRLISALPFILLIIFLVLYLIIEDDEGFFDQGIEAWENGDWLDRLGGILLWIVMIVFFGF